MMATEKLKPEDIDSAMAVSAQHVRPARHREEEAAAPSAAPDFERAPRQSDWLDDRQYEAEIPPYPEDDDELRADQEPIGGYGERTAPRRTLPVVAGGVALLVVAGLVWWMFRPEPAPVEEVPVVMAEPGDVKTRPEDEGGMEVPNRDITVYDVVSEQPATTETEVVMPGPETPITPSLTPDPMVDTAPAAGPEDRAQTEIDAVLAQLQAASAAREAVPAPVGTAGVAETPAPVTTDTQVATMPATTAVEEPAALPQPALTATGVKVQLAAFKSEDQARGAWSSFQQRFPDELSALPLIIEQADLGAKGIFYRVQAGPLASREAAAALCDRLKVQGQTCIVAQ
jgi:cell division septation protein DedD